ncbi:MAG: gamma-glutamyl-gamma-aminobutyrate hydrolase family protein [Phycisphaerae bacterium]|nr:gamma-glutamyl-gamma-aminobutyrate hydrolase family protein [Phycisphaerae bacterium]
MPKAPVIGIPSERVRHAQVGIKDQNTVSRGYTDAICSRGGIPLILPVVDDPAHLSDVIQGLDGLLVPGSDDIPPACYGAAPHPAEKPMPDVQYDTWAALIRLAVDRGLPTLVICGGLQAMNVALGGTLIQDIPSQVGTAVCHRSGTHVDATHEVDILPGSRVAEVLGPGRRTVNSAHHQAVDRLGAGLSVTARCPVDDIVEALELSEHPFCLAVQWHPERYFDGDSSDRLFRAFLAACDTISR